jgi:pSer/pThr/pTyr-binding forkhead associated (FHA) protein
MPEPDASILVRGVRGFLRGEERVLHVGDECVVGRSRAADLSLKRAKRFLERPDRLQIAKSERFLAVSRRHVRIRFLHPDVVEVKDLSANGTLLDGRRVDCVALTDLRSRAHEIGLGATEAVRLEWRPAPDRAPPRNEP